MKKIAAAILLLATLGFGQTVRHFPAKETNNIFTGTNQFNVGARVGPVFFANLPTGTIDGAVLYVQDGSVTNPCTGGGTGAFAYRVLGAWNCSAASSSSIPAGTLNHLVIYTSSSAIGSDAALTDSGGTLGYTGGVFNATNSTSFTIQTAGGFNITETGTNKAANWNISGQLTVNTGTSLAAGLDGLGETRVTGSPKIGRAHV